jgi:hypothetical protein
VILAPGEVIANPLAWVAALVFVALGVSIWFGWDRGMVDPTAPSWYWWFGPPWMALAFLFALVVGGARRVGVPVPEGVSYLVFVPMALGIGAITAGWPRWTIPRWFRDLDEKERRRRATEAPRRGRRRRP